MRLPRSALVELIELRTVLFAISRQFSDHGMIDSNSAPPNLF